VLGSRRSAALSHRSGLVRRGGSFPLPSSTLRPRFSASKRFSFSGNTTTSTTTTTVVTTTTASLGSVSFSRRLWDAYCFQLQHNPLMTKATMAAFIFFLSDSMTQFFSFKRHAHDNHKTDFHWDAHRALSGASFGIVATTWLHYWWNALEGLVGARIPVAHYRLANTMTKVVIDQAIGAPLYIYTYYVVTNFLATASKRTDTTHNGPQPQWEALWKIWIDTNTKAADLLWPTMLQHWKVWPLVHSFNFYFTPLHHRVLVQNTVLVGWSGYLSHLNHSAAERQTVVEEDDEDCLMTPDKEIKVVMKRRETNLRLQQTQKVNP